MGTPIHITDIEAAINWGREQESLDAKTAAVAILNDALSALIQVYAEMVYDKVEAISEEIMPELAYQAWLQWYETTPDAPCIAICSTTQGDAMCKGCGRTFEEVQHWTAMTPAQKRQIWHRITQEGTAWRFNKYKERA